MKGIAGRAPRGARRATAAAIALAAAGGFAIVARVTPAGSGHGGAGMGAVDPAPRVLPVAVVAIAAAGAPGSRPGYCDYPGRLRGIDQLRAAAGVDAGVPVAVGYQAFVRSPHSGEMVLERGTIRAAPGMAAVDFVMVRPVLANGLCQRFGHVAVRILRCVLELPAGAQSCSGRVAGSGS